MTRYDPFLVRGRYPRLVGLLLLIAASGLCAIWLAAFVGAVVR